MYKPLPIPQILNMLLKIEGFTHTSYSDINMGYYHIELSPGSKKLCTIVLPWVKYKNQKIKYAGL